MPTELSTIVLSCSVRHTFGARSTRSRGQDFFHLPELAGRRLELIAHAASFPTAGAEIETDGPIVIVAWWLSAGSPVSYALVVHADGPPIDDDRFIDVSSNDGFERELTFAQWRFRSVWRSP